MTKKLKIWPHYRKCREKCAHMIWKQGNDNPKKSFMQNIIYFDFECFFCFFLRSWICKGQWFSFFIVVKTECVLFSHMFPVIVVYVNLGGRCEIESRCSSEVKRFLSSNEISFVKLGRDCQRWRSRCRLSNSANSFHTRSSSDDDLWFHKHLLPSGQNRQKASGSTLETHALGQIFWHRYFLILGY